MTHAGDQCSKPAAVGSRYCGVHGGARRKVGAPLRISRELIDTIAESIRAGVTYDVAAQSAGIHRSTIVAWRERGEADLETAQTAAAALDELKKAAPRDRAAIKAAKAELEAADSLFALFADELTRATAKGEATLVEAIRAHRYTDWRAAAWLLERRHPERWARRDRLDVEVSERARPRVVEPAEDKRDTILGILRNATAPPTGAPDHR